MNIDEIKDLTTQVRRDIVRMVHKVQSGHPGGSLGCAEFMTALYFKIMHITLDGNPDGRNEDVFFLSNGHISPVYYSVLSRRGYFPVSELNTFRMLNSRLQGHPSTHDNLPGVRIASGSLGQGLSVACGAALAKKMNGDTCLVYSLHGDGELQEGQNWEAMFFAAHHKIDNLIAVIDSNGQQIDGPVKSVMNIAPLKDKLLAFGWLVFEMDGNNMEQVLLVMDQAKQATGKQQPVCVIMNTVMGKGVSFMEGTHEWHGSAPSNAQLAQALSELNVTGYSDY
jgi:transketolase